VHRKLALLDPQVAREVGIVTPSAAERGIGSTRQEHELRALVLTLSASRSLWDCGKKTPTEVSMASDQRLTYSVYSGRRAVEVRKAWSPAEAVIEYLVGLGYRGDEMVRMGPNAVTWRGATFTATQVAVEPTP
jgi:hypothetical protein